MKAAVERVKESPRYARSINISIALRHRWYCAPIDRSRNRSIAQSIDRATIYRSRTTALARSMDGMCARV